MGMDFLVQIWWMKLGIFVYGGGELRGGGKCGVGLIEGE